MKKVAAGLGALALCVLLVAGCTSIPAKAAPEDSLIVVKTEFVNPDGLPRGAELQFKFSKGYEATWIGQYSWDYCVVAIKEPGVEIESLSLRVQANFRGESPEYALHIPLPYEAGKIVIVDFAFVHTIKKTSEHSQSSSFSWRKLEDQEKQDLLKTLAGDESFASWLK
jgi:hypothetical protein